MNKSNKKYQLYGIGLTRSSAIKAMTLTIPTMAATGAVRSPMLIPTVTAVGPNEPIGGA